LGGVPSSHDSFELEFGIEVMQPPGDITDVVFGPEQEVEERKVLCTMVLPEQVNSWD